LFVRVCLMSVCGCFEIAWHICWPHAHTKPVNVLIGNEGVNYTSP